MRAIMRIMKTELRVLFFSPIAWMILIVFAFQAGLAYCGQLESILRNTGLGYPANNITSVFFGGFAGVCSEMLNNLYLYIPLLTMGLISRELSSGSVKLLYSSPVSNVQIILGKYLSMLVYAMMLGGILLLLMIFTLFVVKDASMPYMLTCLLGVFLTTSVYAAIGLFMSSVTKYQVVAAVGTLAVLAILNFIETIGGTIPFINDLTWWLSINGRSRVFLEGLICSSDVLYFMLVIFMFLGFTLIRLQGERLKRSALRISLNYFAVFIFVALAGYVTSLPFMLGYYDATMNKANTLSEESRKIISELDGGLTITTYVNLFDNTWRNASLERKNEDIKRFAQYVRFKPDIKFDYVYYYGKGDDTNYERVYRDMEPEERLKRVCELYGYSPKRFVTAEVANHMDHISAENGRLVRVLKRDDGSTSYLRIFKDMYTHPFENEITTSLKLLMEKPSLVGFVSGHGERDCEDSGGKEFSAFSSDRTFRGALVNNGFDVRKLPLDRPVPPEVDILVIADARSAFTPEEYDNYEQFVDRGGNLIILGEPKRREFMNLLVEKLGLRFADGILVSPSVLYPDDVIPADIQEEALKISSRMKGMIWRGNTVAVSSACALEIADSTKGYEISEVLATKPQGSWIEYTTTDFVNEKSVLNPEKGETEVSRPIMLYLTRELADKPQQRIFVVGDADCFSNKEFTTNRAGLNAVNVSMIREMFRCLVYDRFPLEISRPGPTDNEIYLSVGSALWVNILFLGLFPAVFLIGGTIFLIRRKRG